ncbi:hypothetical protein C0993_004491, partial [Termitomyces sp. T159_Od127]
NATIAVALLLDNATLDQTSGTILDCVSAKVLSQIEGIAAKLSFSADFAAAADAKQAKALLALNEATEQLVELTVPLVQLVQALNAPANPPVEQPAHPS